MPLGNKDYLELGTWNAQCDGCQFKFKAHELKIDWKGLYKCKSCWDARHPMDLQKAPRPSAPIPWARPDKDMSAPRTDITVDPLVDRVGGTIPTGTFTTNNNTL